MVRGLRLRRVALASTLAWASAGVVLGASSDAFAGDPAAARELLKRGYLLAQDGKCDLAVAHFEESLRLDPKAVTLINYADCEEKLGRLSSALGHWVDARGRAKVEGKSDIAEEAERRAALLEPRLARLTVVLPTDAPKDVTVTRDGIPLGSVSLGIETPIDPGAHTLVVKAPGRAELTTQLRLGEGEKKRVELVVGAKAATGTTATTASAPDDRTPAATERKTSPLVWVGFGVGAAGLAVGTITGLMALSRASEAERTCPGGACPDAAALDRVDQGRTLGTVSTIGFVAGGAGVALGAAMLAFGGTSTRAGASTARGFRVDVGPTGAALRGAF